MHKKINDLVNKIESKEGNLNRREFLKSAATTATIAATTTGLGLVGTTEKAEAFAYEPYPKDKDYE
jgi:nitrous oxide reductase